MPGKMKSSGKKLKVGTVLDEQIYQQLKERAVKEGRTISAVVSAALLAYYTTPVIDFKARREAVRRFCSTPFKLTREELEEIMELDFYDQ